MCRHSVVAHVMDIATGERYIYAAIMLYMLMVRRGSSWRCRVGQGGHAGRQAVARRGGGAAHLLACMPIEWLLSPLPTLRLQVQHALQVVVVWYDINCKFGPWFKRWAVAKAVLLPVLQCAAAVLFPLPVWHRYAHRWVPVLGCTGRTCMWRASSRALPMYSKVILLSFSSPAPLQRCLPGA